AEERRESIDKAYRCIEYAETLGTPLIRAFVSNVGSAEATESQWNQCVLALKEISATAHTKEIAFAIETHPKQLMDTVQTTLELIGRVNSPGLQVLLDIWHLFNEGEADPIEALHTLYPHTVHIHAKNMIRHPEGNKIAYFEEGDMDYPSFFEALKSTDYDRFLSVEWFGEESWTAAEHELSYLRRFMGENR
ncbi:MAG: sugar phosphate isomerase/epimerase, partial [Candidatus Latescibacteria bacterium]|nr:sugar phosphate isomerase/epimerase [Candidatus Latescibacterota bacterium]